MKKLLCLSLLLYYVNAFSQNINLPDVSYKLGEFNHSVELHFMPSGASYNSIMERLAEGNGKPVRNVAVRYSFKQRVLLNYNGTGKEIIVNSEKLKIDGDFLYKGYSVSEVLFPSRLQFTLTLLSGNKLIKSFDFSVLIKQGIPDAVIKLYTDSLPKGVKAEIKNIKFDFVPSGVNDFMNEVRKINEYYSAGILLDQVNAILSSVNSANFEYLEAEHQRLHDAIAILNSIDACNYSATLDLTVFDPLNLMRRISLLRSQAAAREAELNLAQDNRYISFYDKGVFLLQSGNTNGALVSFQRSLSFNPSFAPALYQCARINFSKGNLEESAQMAADILFRLNPDPETRHLTNKLNGDLYEAYLDNAATLFNQKKYRKSEGFLLKAQDICEKSSSVRCSNELYDMLKNVRNGIYKDMISEATELYNKNQFDDAENRVQDAGSYRMKYKDDITPSEAERTIIINIRQKEYDKKVVAARSDFNAGKFEDALDNIDSAEELFKKFQLSAPLDFVKLRTDIAKAVANLLLKAGEDAVAVNNLTLARKKKDSAESIFANYQLQEERSLISRVDKLRKGIFSTQCINSQNEFDVHLKNAAAFVIRSDFRKAGRSFESADSVLYANADCKLSEGTFAEERSAVLPAITYLKLFDKSVAEMMNQNYNASFNSYNEAGKYFGQFDVGKFGIIHKQQFDYIIQDAAIGMAVYAGDYYRTTNQLELSVNIYKNLLLRKYDYRQLKGSMYKLGYAVATRDKLKSASDEWKAAAGKYAGNEKEWKTFYKGFKKSWKN